MSDKVQQYLDTMGNHCMVEAGMSKDKWKIAEANASVFSFTTVRQARSKAISKGDKAMVEMLNAVERIKLDGCNRNDNRVNFWRD